MAKRATYYSDAVERMIAADPSGVESFSGRVGFLIGAAVKIAEESCPALTVGEWQLVATAMNGTAHNYEMGVGPVLSGLFHAIYDISPEEAEHFGTDNESLARRLLKSSTAEQLAVFEVGRRFWQTQPGEGETYPQLFSRIGANLK